MGSFQEDCTIDPNALDVEWLKQAELVVGIAKEAADAKRKVEKCKLALDVLEAELYKAIKNDPKSFGLEKVTEAAVTAEVKLQKKYQEAREAHIEARHESAVLDAGVSALSDQKKKALENLVYLHGQSYFAGPKVPRDIGAEFISDSEKREARGRVSKRLNDGRGGKE